MHARSHLHTHSFIHPVQMASPADAALMAAVERAEDAFVVGSSGAARDAIPALTEALKAAGYTVPAPPRPSPAPAGYGARTRYPRTTTRRDRCSTRIDCYGLPRCLLRLIRLDLSSAAVCERVA